MTTQKAIEAITDFRAMAHGHAVLAEAFDMAIEALSAQPEKSTTAEKSQLAEEKSTCDLISRQAAIDTLMNDVPVYGLLDDDGNIESGCKDKDIVTMLYNLPSAQPEREKGKWIDDNCSECGQYVYHGDMRRYCPRCGADMRGDIDD